MKQFPNSKVPRTHLNELMTQYTAIISQQQYEGDGIWKRFNILLGTQIVLIGAAYYAANLNQLEFLLISLSLAIIGLILSLWSLKVCRLLWGYHYNWVESLIYLESKLPAGFATPFLNLDKDKELKLPKRLTRGDWFKPFTQPFFLISTILWVVGSGILIWKIVTLCSMNTIECIPSKWLNK